MIDRDKPGEFGDGYRFALDEIEEAVREMRKHDPYLEPLGKYEVKPRYDHLDIFGYNQALDDLLTHLQA